MKYSIKPEDYELSKARKIVEEALPTCKAFMEKEKSFRVSLGWLENSETGANGGAEAPDSVFVNFNTSTENWEEEVKTATAYGYARSLFLEKVEWEYPEFYWQEVLMEGFSLMFLEKVFPEESGNELPEIKREVLADEWKDWKKDLSTDIRPDEYFPWEYGYLIGQELAKEYAMKEIPGLKRSDVIDAGDRIFS